MHLRKFVIVLSVALLSLQACRASPSTTRETAIAEKTSAGSPATPSTAQLWCYVCDDCAKITEQTHVEQCNADFFAPSTTTTTTELPSSTTTTTTPSTTTEVTTITTEKGNTTEEDVTTSEISTEPPIPTPPTAGPTITTTAVPTPPIIGVNSSLNAEEEAATEKNLTPPVLTTITTVPSLRRRRAATISDGYTYHCYSIQKKQNESIVTQRGCSRVTATEGVCGQLELESGNATISKCTPCTMSRCNGSSSLTVSIMAFVVAIVAALLHSN